MEWHLNTSCEWPDLVVDNQSISVPARMDGECHYNSVRDFVIFPILTASFVYYFVYIPQTRSCTILICSDLGAIYDGGL